MKRVGKILLYIFLTIILAVVVLVIVAAFSQNKIARLAVNEIEKTTDIPIDVGTIEFSLIRNFPMATIQCKQLTIHSPVSTFKSESDTLFHADQFFVSVDVKPLLYGFFKIRKVELNQAEIYYRIDSSGISNFDFLKDTTQETVIDTSSNSFSLDLENLKAGNLVCFYEDRKLKTRAKLQINSLDVSGQVKNNDYRGIGEVNATLSDCEYPGTKFHLLQQLNLDLQGAFENDSVKIDRAEVNLDNDARLIVNGDLAIADTLWAKLFVKAEIPDLGGLTKYAPDSLFEQYGISNTSGNLATDASIEGKINGAELPAVNAAFKFSGGKVKYLNYPELRSISIQGELNNGKKRTLADTNIRFQNLKFQTDSSRFSFSGSVKNPEHPVFDLRSNLDISLKEIAGFIPDSLVPNLSGHVLADITAKRVIPDSISDVFIASLLDHTEISADLKNVSVAPDSTNEVSNLNGRIEYKPGKIYLNGLNGQAATSRIKLKNFQIDADITGSPLHPDSLDIQLSRMSAALDNSRLEISGTIKNLLHPSFSLVGQLDIDLAEIKPLLPDSLVNSMSGNVNARFRSVATINPNSVSDQIISVLMEKSSFDLDLQNISVGMPDSLMNFKSLTGSLSYQDDSFRIKELAVNYMGIQAFMNSVKAANIYSAVIQQKPVEINVNGNFYIDQVDYDQFGVFLAEKPSGSNLDESDQSTGFKYKINGNLHARRLKYGKAVFENIQSKFLVKEDYYVVDSMTMNAFEGDALTSAKVEMGDTDQLTIWINTQLRNMDVTQLVDAFGEYLGSYEIQKNNVQGKLSSDLDGKIVMKDSKPDYEAMLLKGDLTLENGALFNVKPVVEIENISGVGIKNLDSLYFSTLNSSIFLFRNDLYFPRTEIRTSSFDAMLLGMYSFGEDYAYHIRMFLGEVLSSKSKAHLRKQAREGGFSEEDEKDITKGRTSIYVVSKSENGKEKAGFDNKHDRSNMVARVNLQKQMLDMRFHPTLVSYNTEE